MVLDVPRWNDAEAPDETQRAGFGTANGVLTVAVTDFWNAPSFETRDELAWNGIETLQDVGGRGGGRLLHAQNLDARHTNIQVRMVALNRAIGCEVVHVRVVSGSRND